MSDTTPKPKCRYWRWLFLAAPAVAGSLFISIIYVGTAWQAERLLAWMDGAQQQGLQLARWPTDPFPFARKYPMLRRILARPLVMVVVKSAGQLEAFDSLPPCPAEVRIYAHHNADPKLVAAVKARQPVGGYK